MSQLVPAGLRLLPPRDCPPLIKKLMGSCWKQNPSERITFDAICYELKNSILDQVPIILTVVNYFMGLEEHKFELGQRL